MTALFQSSPANFLSDSRLSHSEIIMNSCGETSDGNPTVTLNIPSWDFTSGNASFTKNDLKFSPIPGFTVALKILITVGFEAMSVRPVHGIHQESCAVFRERRLIDWSAASHLEEPARQFHEDQLRKKILSFAREIFPIAENRVTRSI